MLRPLSAALALTLLSAPLAAEPTLFGNKVTMGTVADMPLTAAQKRTLAWYRSNKSYFGAFYVVPDTDHFFWTRNFHSLDTAKAAAKKGCEIVSEGKACALYAVVYPQGTNPNARGVSGLSQPAAKDFQRRYPKQQKDGTYGAFAVNRSYSWGVSFGWKTKQEAEAAALSYCKAGSAIELAPLPIEGRKWVKAQGLEACRVVDVRAPSK